MISKFFYLIGIKGVAMTALAVYLKQKGHRVEGSDVEEIFSTDRILKDNNIKIHKGFKSKNISKDINIVVATGAHGGATNIEMQTAVEFGIPNYMHGVFLGKIMQHKYGIAIAGCHGKTTTSALIAKILIEANLDPSYLIGTAYINGLGPAGHSGKSNYLIAEADEYMTCPQTDRTPRFLHLHPQIAIITNIDYDHPDEFKNLNQVKNVYLKFAAGLPKNAILILCIDDPAIKSILKNFKNKKIITYGFNKTADYRILSYTREDSRLTMNIKNNNKDQETISINILGIHNLLNALAASIVCEYIGVDWNKIKKNILNFTGSNRRFEKIADYKDFMLFDDYAHHPQEIKSTLNAIKERFPDRKIIIIFQPHTYSRTKKLINEFENAFYEADSVYITDIFSSAREKRDNSINSNILVQRINSIKPNANYIKNLNDLFSKLSKSSIKSSIIMTMGAGNLNQWHEKIKIFLSNYE